MTNIYLDFKDYDNMMTDQLNKLAQKLQKEQQLTKQLTEELKNVKKELEQLKSGKKWLIPIVIAANILADGEEMADNYHFVPYYRGISSTIVTGKQSLFTTF